MQVLENVWVIKGYSNTFLTQDGVLIDCGVKGEEVVKTADSLGIKLKSVLLTHYHPDHTRGLRELKERLGVKVVAPELDSPFVEGRSHARKGIIQRLAQAFLRSNPVKVDLVVRNGDTVEGMRVIHLPGHTPGSSAYLWNDILFSGDSLLERKGRPSLPPSIFSWDQNVLKRSIRNLNTFKFSRVLPGHGASLEGESVKAFIALI